MPSHTENWTELYWTECAKATREHDEGVARTWKEEIDPLPVFLNPTPRTTPDTNTAITAALKFADLTAHPVSASSSDRPRKLRDTWVALEEGFLDEFAENVTMEYLHNEGDDQNPDFRPDSLTLRRF
ncbi:hypothetical protein CERSUDRAFT_71662 [Gelatoporia subvermispora B]|uniref:Uncharacterized protein n=1 Tax=Ceriporiopsis subvermispora (strain B) TaxID=914234 RepID=M2R5D4_CERS8|nr:hypothetical protein CERSUDRAFT_71662 [Gelatoporia subvermispora B]